MPLFNKKAPATTAPVVETQPKRSSTLFGRKNETSPSPTTTTTHSTTSNHTQKTGILHRRDEDPSIITARERLMNAEAAEREADKALMSAKIAVKDAREQIKKLEREAAEEARLARVKQDQAKSMSKRGNLLGREYWLFLVV